MVRCGDPDLAKGSLDAIQQTGRQALVELRRLLGVLGDEPSLGSRSPQPGLEQLPTLVETLRVTGLAVDLRVLGTACALQPGVDVTAYRIIQEALTNAARHAGPAEVTVSVTYGDEAVEIEVQDTGQGPTVPGSHRTRTGRDEGACCPARRQDRGGTRPNRRLRGSRLVATKRSAGMIRVIIADDQAPVRG